jgi:probable rRNA maturation factor
MKVRTLITENHTGVPRRKMAWLARRVLKGEGGEMNVSLVFAGDDSLRTLNRDYRNLDRTTDVLSFNIPGVPHVIGESGELYISLPQARKQARRYRHSLERELHRLVVHGTLHLLGFDHKKVHEARRMRAREAVYCKGPH